MPRKQARPRTPAEVILSRRSNLNLLLGYRDLFVRVAVIALCIWLLLSHVFLLTQASGNDMFPAVKDGDLIFGFRLQQEYYKNDVVVYEDPDGQTRIGRIIARGGDVVTMSDTGTLLVNGTAQSGEIMYPTYAVSGIEYPYQVPEGSVFILGDYRTQATDSRHFGPVALDDLEGKVITIVRRRGL